MSSSSQRPTKQSQVTAQIPPPPRSSIFGRVGLPSASSRAPLPVMPQVVDHGREDGDGSSVLDLVRHRVVPVAGLGGHLPQFNSDLLQEDNDEFSGLKLGTTVIGLLMIRLLVLVQCLKRRNFAYMHCWKILKDQPKWLERHNHSSTPSSKVEDISRSQSFSSYTCSSKW